MKIFWPARNIHIRGLMGDKTNTVVIRVSHPLQKYFTNISRISMPDSKQNFMFFVVGVKCFMIEYVIIHVLWKACNLPLFYNTTHQPSISG